MNHEWIASESTCILYSSAYILPQTVAIFWSASPKAYMFLKYLVAGRQASKSCYAISKQPCLTQLNSSVLNKSHTSVLIACWAQSMQSHHRKLRTRMNYVINGLKPSETHICVYMLYPLLREDSQIKQMGRLGYVYKIHHRKDFAEVEYGGFACIQFSFHFQKTTNSTPHTHT